MKIKELAKLSEKFLIDNSPGILTGLGVAGTITTLLLGGRAAWRVGMDASTQYHEAIVDGAPLPENLLEKKYLVQTYWKEFIPATIALAATVTSIVMANQVSARRAAAITAAFKLSEQMSEEYREKIVKTLGARKEEEARAELAGERMTKAEGSGTIIISGTGVLCFDELSGRFFDSDMETIRKAVNDINHQVNNYYAASLSEFYEKIGLPKTVFSDDVGWNTDSLLDVHFSSVVHESRPALSITYNQTPIHGFDRCN